MERRKPLVRKKGLTRKTPLKNKTPLRRSPIKPKAGKWDLWRRRERQVVMQQRNRCEVFECNRQSEEWHHPFMRSHVIPEPWASWRVLTLAICRHHHEQIHAAGGTQLRDDLRWLVVLRLTGALNRDDTVALFPLPEIGVEIPPVRAVRMLIEHATTHNFRQPNAT